MFSAALFCIAVCSVRNAAMLGRTGALCLFIGCASFGSAVFAQSAATSANDAPTEYVTLNMRDAEIRAVIQWIAEQTRKQIVIDPRVQGKVTAYADRPMTVEQAYRVFLSLLEVQGYSASDVDGVLRIYPSALAKISPRNVVDDFGKFDEVGQVMHVVTVKNVSNSAIAQLVKPLVSTTGYIAPLESSDALLVADNADNVKRIVELVQRLDRAGSLDIAVVKLQHANAKDVAQVISGLVKNSGAAGAASGASSPLSVAFDDRSNSILLAGESGSRQRAQQLILQLDRPLGSNNTSRVVFLNYLSAEELLPILKSVTNTAQKESKDQEIAAAPISIEASKSNNAIVMTGPPDILSNLQTVIGRLDVQRAQVLVEALIVEVGNEIANDIGVLWQTKNMADLEGSGGVAAVSALGQLEAVVTDSEGNIAGPGRGLTLGYYTGGDLQAAIRALSANSKVNVLSTPSVMTLDNQQAQIIVGSNIPIITGQSTGTSSTTDNPFTTFERQDIGVTLKITPQVNSDKSVTLDIVQEVQTVANTANTALSAAQDIVTNKRSITTKVLVQDDRTLVLGGLISDQRQRSESKVPILGDMPLVGRLFRSTNDTVTKQNLMVFIHPVVVDSETLANRLARENYQDMRVRQMKYEDGKLESSGPPPLPEFEEILPRRADAPPASEN